MTLRDAIRAAGISQSELSRRSGVDLRLIQRMVSGESKMGNIAAKNLIAIADALNVDPRGLI